MSTRHFGRAHWLGLGRNEALGPKSDWGRANTSVYLLPEPVLNRMARSDFLRNPVWIRWSYAAVDAAPSGESNIPSLRAQSHKEVSSCWSLKATTVPPDFRTSSRMM